MSDVEPLCGNPFALTTPRGLNKKRPCGYWEAEGLGWCNAKDYNDWVAEYKIILDAAILQFKNLIKIMNKNKSNINTAEMLDIKMKLDDFGEDYKEIEKQSWIDETDYSSQKYSQKISGIITKLEELLCLIEQIQTLTENEKGAEIKPTGLLGRDGGTWGFWQYAGVIGAVAGLYWVGKRML